MSLRMNRTAIQLCLLSIAFVATKHAFGQTTGETSSTASPASSQASATELLQWKFEVGDDIKVQHQIVEIVTDSDNQRLRNRRDYHFVWTVTDVAPDGLATIEVKPMLIRLQLELPPVLFDSERDDPTVETERDSVSRPWIYEARSMANAGFTFKVNPKGGVHSTWGALPHLKAIPVEQFMTGDMPALPARPISSGESWTVDVGVARDGCDLAGRATYRLAGKDVVDGRSVCRIEGKVNWGKMGSPLGTAILYPTNSVSHFDTEAGRFLDEELNGGGQTTYPSGQIAKLRQRIRRRLVPTAMPLRESPKSAEYIFAFEGDKVHYLQIEGQDQNVEGLRKVDQAMYLAFYHEWNDANQNRIPDPGELSDLTNEFTAEEGISFFVNAMGMQEASVRADVVDSQGLTVGTVPVRIVRGPGAFAIRQLKNLDAGVYFFEWYVNNEFLIRVPVQVRSLVPSLAAESVEVS